MAIGGSVAYGDLTFSQSNSSSWSKSWGSELVQQGWAESRAYSDEMVGLANQFLAEMATASQDLNNLPDVSDELSPIDYTIDAVGLPTVPTKPTDLQTSFPTPPDAPNLGTVGSLTLPNAPEFLADKPAINLNVPLPDPLGANVPADPTLNDVVVPDAPTLDIPAAPDLRAIDLPNAPLLDLPTFAATLEDAPLAPDPQFSFTEAGYTSDLTAGLNAFLLEWVNGAATGLDPKVEQAIWERAKAREESATLRQAEDVRRSFATRGFEAPPGAMLTAMQEALQTAEDKLSSINRDIMIKQAELEQENRRFAVSQAINWESQLLTFASQQAQRSLEAARFAATLVIQIFESKVQLFNAQVQAFNVRATVYRTQIEAELSKLEVYKTELEGQKLIGELNEQDARIYRTRVEAVLATIEIFRAQVAAAETQANVNRTIIQGYGERVNAYKAQVDAKSAEYDQYATRVKTEATKIDIFKAEAEAYAAEVQGYSALTDAKIAEKEAEIKIEQEIPLELFKTKIEAFAEQIRGESERIRSIASVYDTEVKAYAAEAGAKTDVLASQTDVYKTLGDLRVAEAGIRIEAAKQNIEKLLSSVELLTNSKEQGARIFAQIAASALSSVNFNASDSGGSESQSTSSSSSHEEPAGYVTT